MLMRWTDLLLLQKVDELFFFLHQLFGLESGLKIKGIRYFKGTAQKEW